jgi:exodeoxyribonuclease-3
MNVTTWNVNSIRARHSTLLGWIDERQPDVLGLQELKCVEEELPWKELRDRGYHVEALGQKTYNGVALLSRRPICDVAKNGHWREDPQARAIVGTVDFAPLGALRILCLYVVNGQEVGCDKYAYKLDWLARLHTWVAALPPCPTVICGDYNIAPADNDVLVPAHWQGKILCSDPERAAWRGLCGLGYTDAFRAMHPTRQQFTWWDYRNNGFETNDGLRIDHHLVSAEVLPRVLDVTVDMGERAKPQASDHAPVTLHLRD